MLPPVYLSKFYSEINTVLLIYQRKEKINLQLMVSNDRCPPCGYYELICSTLPTK